MSFKDMMLDDRLNVFLNEEFFGEKRTIVYNGNTYEDITVVLTGGNGEYGRKKRYADHSNGIYNVSEIVHVRIEDIGGEQPEQGIRFSMNDEEGSEFFKEYYVDKSYVEGGMCRIDLRAVDE